jgi:hypothetical protein
MNALSLLAAVALLQGGGAQRQNDVRAAYTIEPESIHVGDPAILRVRVIAPAGSKVVFPGAVDSTSSVEPLDPVSVREEMKDGMLESVASYRFVAWELGLPVISLGTIVVDMNGTTRELKLGDPRVFVMTILPADTAQRVPRPSRDIAVLPASNWQWWILIAVGFVVAGILGLWFQRRAHRPPAPIEPVVAARRAFGRLDALDLIGAGEPAKHVAASAGILRNFLAMRNASAGTGLTTAELLAVLHVDGAVPSHRVETVLATADAIKFAAQGVDAASAEALGAESLAIVSEIHRADNTRARKK